MKFKHFSYDDGRITNVAYMDGYNFGDRMLEGVMFKVEVVKNKLVVNFVEPNGDYELGLNQKKWLKEAKEYAEENDIFSENKDGFGEDLFLETLED